MPSAFEGIGHLTMNVLEWTFDYHKVNNVALRTQDTHLSPTCEWTKVTAMSLNEASSRRENSDYFHLNLGFNDPAKETTSDQQFKIIKLKFLNGESQYSQEELKLVKKWFKEQGFQKMQKLYMEHILKGYPQKAQRFENSPLQNLFATG